MRRLILLVLVAALAACSDPAGPSGPRSINGVCQLRFDPVTGQLIERCPPVAP